jgi:hypothetical protein
MNTFPIAFLFLGSSPLFSCRYCRYVGTALISLIKIGTDVGTGYRQTGLAISLVGTGTDLGTDM